MDGNGDPTDKLTMRPRLSRRDFRNRFTESFDTAELESAKALLDSLA